LWDLVRASLEGCAEECPGGTKGDGLAAAEAVKNRTDEWEGDDGADGLDGIQKTENGAARVAEFCVLSALPSTRMLRGRGGTYVLASQGAAEDHS
jgi:hypothetical protein